MEGEIHRGKEKFIEGISPPGAPGGGGNFSSPPGPPGEAGISPSIYGISHSSMNFSFHL